MIAWIRSEEMKTGPGWQQGEWRAGMKVTNIAKAHQVRESTREARIKGHFQLHMDVARP